MSHSPKPAAQPTLRFKLALTTIVVAFVWWVIDLNTASTFITTPANWIVRRCAWLAGAIVAGWAVFSVCRHLFAKDVPDRAKRHRNTIWTAVAMGMIFGAFIADQAMWRMLNLYHFHDSSAPIKTVVLPIRSVTDGRGGRQVTIGSAGERDSMSISKQDFALLGGTQIKRPPWTYCIPLRWQMEGDVVRLWHRPRIRPSFTGTTIVPCPATMRDLL